MKPNLKQIANNHKKVLAEVKKMRIKGYSVKNNQIFFKGQLLDLSATNPDPLSIAYTTLSQVLGNIYAF